jgi:hypothetical protein
MNKNPRFKNLTINQHQQLMRFMKEHSLDFPKESLCLFSMGQFVRRRLLEQIRPSISYNCNQINDSYKEFLKRCSMKFGLYLSPQFIIRGRFNLINLPEIVQLMSSNSLQTKILSISHYGTAILLGNTSAIAEMVIRLSKISMYDHNGNADNRLKNQLLEFELLKLIEYGISRRCPDCLGMMSHFLDTGFGIVPVDRQRALKLAGQSAEAGSIYGWFALARLLKDNSDNASYQDRYDDGIDIDESDLGVRLFVCEKATRDEQIRRTLKEHGCESCLDQFYYGKDECPDCNFDLTLFNFYPDDDDTSVPKLDQMQIAVKIYYKILSENPPSHPLCVDSRKNLVEIYKQREWLFGGSIEATDEEIRRLEAV